MAQFSQGGAPGPAAALSPILVKTPTLQNIVLGTAGTEGSFNIPVGTKYYRIRARDNSKLQFSFITGQSGTNFYSINPGSTYQTPDTASLDLDTSLVIFIQSTKDSTVVEVEAWA